MGSRRFRQLGGSCTLRRTEKKGVMENKGGTGTEGSRLGDAIYN